MLVQPGCILGILKMSLDLLRKLPLDEVDFNDLFSTKG